MSSSPARRVSAGRTEVLLLLMASSLLRGCWSCCCLEGEKRSGGLPALSLSDRRWLILRSLEPWPVAGSFILLCGCDDGRQALPTGWMVDTHLGKIVVSTEIKKSLKTQQRFYQPRSHGYKTVMRLFSYLFNSILLLPLTGKPRLQNSYVFVQQHIIASNDREATAKVAKQQNQKMHKRRRRQRG